MRSVTIAQRQSADRGNRTRASRRFLAVLTQGERKPFTQGSGRLELAQASTSKDNPLTARVIVNRVWQYHFGRGIVASASDFGKLGEKPTHPELLAWLAGRAGAAPAINWAFSSTAWEQ